MSLHDGCSYSDAQPKGRSNLLGVHATVHKTQTTSLLSHFLPSMSQRSGKDKLPKWQDQIPLCQIEVAVPETGRMETLPSCFYVKNLLDILAIKECNTSKVACGNCDAKSEEASYCFHCGGFWCNDCVNAHNILRANKEHRVLSLKDFRDEDFEDVLRRPAFCQKELHRERGPQVLL